MKIRKLICLLLALALIGLCFAGCRDKKTEEPQEEAQAEQNVEEPEQKEEPEKEETKETEETEENAEIEEPVPEGLIVDEEPLEIIIPEDSELGGDTLVEEP